MQTEKYETAEFSITIPKGWTVSTGGINIYHSIRVYDPAEPLNQMFILLKAEPLLHCEEGKAAWQYSYSAGSKQNLIFAKAPVLKNPSTEGFLKFFRSMPILYRRLSRHIRDTHFLVLKTSP